MNYLRDQIEDMLADEQEASAEYIELAEALFNVGISKADAIKVMNIARDEQRHFEILKAILKKL